MHASVFCFRYHMNHVISAIYNNIKKNIINIIVSENVNACKRIIYSIYIYIYITGCLEINSVQGTIAIYLVA